MAGIVSPAWIVVLGGGAVSFAVKYLGHLVPARWLRNPRIQRINIWVPVVLLSALIASEALTTKTHIVFDHRLAGVGAALLAVRFRAPFAAVVLSAAVTSAIVVHLL